MSVETPPVCRVCGSAMFDAPDTAAGVDCPTCKDKGWGDHMEGECGFCLQRRKECICSEPPPTEPK